jgi:hypothetical protein
MITGQRSIPRSGLRLSREEDMVGLLVNLEPNLAVLL